MAAVDRNTKIIVSYRRSDSAMAGRIFDRLERRFGKTSLFIDIDNIPYGVDFRKHIDDALKSSDLLIAVVGEKWLGSRDGGDARIMNAADPVRVELETALERNINILPVLLDNTKMPDPQDLPDSIKNFAYLNAIDVESGRDFNIHIERLIGAIEQSLGFESKSPAAGARRADVSPLLPTVEPKNKRRLLPLMLGVVGLLLVAGLGAAVRFWIADRAETVVAGRAVPRGFCGDLKQVVAAAPTKFVSILGPLRNAVWTARIQLPGWDNCSLQDWTYEGKTTRYFGCELPTFANIIELDAMLDAVDAYVKPCLGQD